MEELRPEQSEELTFEDALKRVIAGEMRGWAIYTDAGIIHQIGELEEEPPEVPPGVRLLDMTAEEAQAMLEGMDEEERQEIGRSGL